MYIGNEKWKYEDLLHSLMYKENRSFSRRNCFSGEMLFFEKAQFLSKVSERFPAEH